MAGDYLDLEGLIQTAESAPSLEDNEFPDIITVESPPMSRYPSA